MWPLLVSGSYPDTGSKDTQQNLSFPVKLEALKSPSELRRQEQGSRRLFKKKTEEVANPMTEKSYETFDIVSKEHEKQTK